MTSTICYLFLLCLLCGARAKQNRPKPEGQVNVTASIAVASATFDEKTRTMSGLVWVTMNWKDERLSSSEPVRHVSPDEIWTPDITFYHSPFRVEEADALVFADGTVLYVPKVFYSETCVTSSVRFFPHDSYVCRLALGSWTYGKSELLLTLGDPTGQILEPFQHNPVWDVSLKEAFLHEKVYPLYPTEIYPKALYDIQLERKCSSLGLTIVFPAVALALMTLAMFLIPSESREKVTFGAIIFLALILIMKDLPNLLPSGGVTAISCFYAVDLTLVALALFLHCCLVLISYPVNSSVRPSPALRRFASGLSRISCLPTEHLDLDDINSDDSEMSNSAKGARNIAEWRFIARMLDRIFLILFFLLLVVLGILSIVMAEEELLVPNL